MPQINQLSALAQVSSGDQIPVYAPSNGDARRMSVSQLLDYFESNFVDPTTAVTLYSPVAGFTITAANPTDSQNWLLFQPAGTLGASTLILPPPANVPDGTEFLVTSTQIISPLTVQGNGATVNGAPSSLAVNNGFRLRYYQAQNTWYAIASAIPIAATAAAFLASPTSANLAAAVTDETGSGALVFATSPTLVTPNIGSAAATSVSATGQVSASNFIAISGDVSVSSTGTIGYSGTAGGFVIQSGAVKTQSVTLDNPTGQIQTNAGTVNAGATVSIPFSNSKITAKDLLVLNHVSGGTVGSYLLNAHTFASGSCQISVTNVTAGGLSEAITISFAIIRGDS